LEDDNASIVRREMTQDVQDIFRIRAQLLRDFLGRFSGSGSENVFHAALQFERARRSLLPGLDPRLKNSSAKRIRLMSMEKSRSSYRRKYF
jgi:hypothetical protein